MEASEEWRPAPGLVGRYEISSLGRVRHAVTGNMPTLQRCPRGYLWLKYQHAERKYVANASVARLVCHAFNGPPPEDGLDVDHRNRVRDDNVPKNLRWLSRAGNLENRVCASGEVHHAAKLTEAQVREILTSTEKPAELAIRHGVARRTISDVIRRITWRSVNA